MFYINVWLTVKDPANIPTVEGLLVQAAKGSQAEPGCERFEVYHSEATPGKFLLSEHWTTKADWEVHRTAKTYTEIYFPKVIPLVDREGHICAKVG